MRSSSAHAGQVHIALRRASRGFSISKEQQMSGICGLVHWDRRPVDSLDLDKMAQAAAHRGPDGVRRQIRGPAGFAHLALHITPESVREAQPLGAPDDEILLVADARIDNRSELVDSLETKGLRMDPAPTDAALILAAYRTWGAECPSRLVGDFAFAVWDASQKRLFAARDPMGMRAFYYRSEPKRFLFATEVKQILAASGVSSELFEPAVAAHLAGCFEHLDWSFYRGVEQLPPGHALVADGAESRAWRYWDVDPERRIQYRDERQYAEHFLEIFREAVRSRIRSVKPIGILLSGGMDSGSIASTAGALFEQESTPCPSFHAFSWAFEELTQCDERRVSDAIVRHFGFPATTVDAENYGPLKDYPAHGPDRDEPFMGVYQALLERSMSMAKAEGMGLLLSGDRGDLVAGEYIYDYPGLFRSGHWITLLRELRMRARWKDVSLASAVRTHLVRPWRSTLWPQERAPQLRRHVAAAYHFFNGGRPPGYAPWIQPDFARRIGLDDIVRAARYDDRADARNDARIGGIARRQRHAAIFAPMHMRGVVWSERTQARLGLGFADAWSDRRLAEFAVAVPQRVLNHTGDDKRLVRRAMSGVMPEVARRAARKVSPHPLFMKALTDTATKTVSDLLRDSRAAALGYVDARALVEHHREILETHRDHPGFWAALTLEMWLRQYWS